MAHQAKGLAGPAKWKTTLLSYAETLDITGRTGNALIGNDTGGCSGLCTLATDFIQGRGAVAMKLLAGILIALAIFFASLNPANAQQAVTCKDIASGEVHRFEIFCPAGWQPTRLSSKIA